MEAGWRSRKAASAAITRIKLAIVKFCAAKRPIKEGG